MNELMSLLYTSELAPDEPPASVAEIVRVARTKNAQLDITGVLLFDGDQFCQYLEGSPEAVLPLLATIEMDRRHVNVRVRHLGTLPGPRRFVGWNIGYATMPGQTLNDYFQDATGSQAIAALDALLPSLDFVKSA